MFDQEMTDIISKGLDSCKGRSNSFKPQFHPDIPEKHLKRALKHFVEFDPESSEQVLMLWDTSLFEKGKNGLAFTDRAVYHKGIFGKTMICRYKDWNIGCANASELLGLEQNEEMFLAEGVAKIVDGLCEIKKAKGMFEQEAEEDRSLLEKRKAEENDYDDDNDDDDGFGLLDVVDIVTDITSDEY